MSNAKLIQNTKTTSLPYFPELSVGKTKRVVTKHFTNLSLWLPSPELELLSFLIYECLADNTFEYSTRLLERYCAAVKAATKQYWGSEDGTRTPLLARIAFRHLIESGLILHTEKKNVFMINPMLTYSPDIINNKQYKLVSEMYQYTSPDKIQVFVDYYRKLVSDYLESKKPNYKYRK